MMTSIGGIIFQWRVQYSESTDLVIIFHYSSKITELMMALICLIKFNYSSITVLQYSQSTELVKTLIGGVIYNIVKEHIK